MVHSKKGKMSVPHLNEQLEKKKDFYCVSHFGTPIKDVRLKPPVIHKVTSVTNLSQASLRAPAPLKHLKCSKSLSLQDLSPGFQRQVSQRRICIYGKKERHALNMPDNADPLDGRKKVLALKFYSRFLRNAWRKNKEASEVQDVYLKSAYGQIANFKIQVSSLKSILKSDEETISSSFSEIRSLKGLLAKLQDKYSLVKTEKEEMAATVSKLKDELSEVRSESLNDKNSLIIARSEALALEAQLQREREKINKLKTENRALLDKVDKLSANLKSKNEKMNNLNQTVEKMEREIDSQVNLLKTVQFKIEQDQRALDDASTSLKNLKKELGDSQNRETRLRSQLEESTGKLMEHNRRYDTFVKEQTLKMIRLETELALYAPSSLKSRLISMASSALNIPLHFLEIVTWGS